MKATKLPVGATELRELLRHWRDLRGKSQLELSLQTGISQKHISFVESGRSTPSRETLLSIASALDVPFGNRNALLLAAGYAPMYSTSPWDFDAMKNIAFALRRLLRQHEPFPALVMDRYWNVLMTNEGAPRFFNSFVDWGTRPEPHNMLHLMFDPEGLRPFIADWEAVAKAMFERAYREPVGRVVDNKTRQLVAELQAYPAVCKNGNTPIALSSAPVIPLSFIKGERRMNYFSLVTTVGTPHTVAAQELRIECMFPADDETESQHVAAMKAP